MTKIRAKAIKLYWKIATERCPFHEEEMVNSFLEGFIDCAEYLLLQNTEPEKENEELKDYNKKLLLSDIDKQNKIVLLSKKVNDLQKKNVGLKDELNKAKVIINKWLRVYNTNTTKEVIKESEDFLKEE